MIPSITAFQNSHCLGYSMNIIIKDPVRNNNQFVQQRYNIKLFRYRENLQQLYERLRKENQNSFPYNYNMNNISNKHIIQIDGVYSNIFGLSCKENKGNNQIPPNRRTEQPQFLTRFTPQLDHETRRENLEIPLQNSPSIQSFFLASHFSNVHINKWKNKNKTRLFPPTYLAASCLLTYAYL